MSEEIKMTFDKDGNIKMDSFKGAVGPDCEKLTSVIRNLGKVTKEKKTDDWYKSGGPKIHTSTSVRK